LKAVPVVVEQRDPFQMISENPGEMSETEDL